MDTAGESPVKRVKKLIVAGGALQDRRNAIRGTRSTILGAFAFAWLAQNYGTANCKVAPTRHGGERSFETQRGIVGAGETTAGSPQDSWVDSGRANESDGSEYERYVSGRWKQCGQGARGTWG